MRINRQAVEIEHSTERKPGAVLRIYRRIGQMNLAGSDCDVRAGLRHCKAAIIQDGADGGSDLRRLDGAALVGGADRGIECGRVNTGETSIAESDCAAAMEGADQRVRVCTRPFPVKLYRDDAIDGALAGSEHFRDVRAGEFKVTPERKVLGIVADNELSR